MKPFTTWLLAKISERGLGVRPLARQSGFGTTAIQQWMDGRLPNLESAARLANFFGERPEFVMGLVAEQKRLDRSSAEMDWIPLAPFPLGAGPAVYQDVVTWNDSTTWTEWTQLPKGELQDVANVVAYRVQGTSMEHVGIPDGSLVYVNKKKSPELNNDVVAWLPEGGIVKRLVEREGKRYLAGNGAPAIPVDEGVVFGGVVVMRLLNG